LKLIPKHYSPIILLQNAPSFQSETLLVVDTGGPRKTGNEGKKPEPHFEDKTYEYHGCCNPDIFLKYPLEKRWPRYIFFCTVFHGVGKERYKFDAKYFYSIYITGYYELETICEGMKPFYFCDDPSASCGCQHVFKWSCKRCDAHHAFKAKEVKFVKMADAFPIKDEVGEEWFRLDLLRRKIEKKQGNRYHKISQRELIRMMDKARDDWYEEPLAKL